MWEEESGKRKKRGGGVHSIRIIRIMIKIKQPFQNLRMQQVQNINELVMKSPKKTMSA